MGWRRREGDVDVDVSPCWWPSLAAHVPYHWMIRKLSGDSVERGSKKYKSNYSIIILNYNYYKYFPTFKTTI
jgi:hypothetical protein